VTAPDAIVVGAGPAGICAWDLLRRAGCTVELLEAGPCDVATPPVTRGDDPDWAYAVDGDPADWGRVYGLGGRAHMWGGWLGRFSDAVLSRGDWPMPPAEMASAYARAERWLGSVEHPLPARFAALEACGGELSGRIGADHPDSPWRSALAEARRVVRGRSVALRLVHHDGRARGLEVHTPHGIERRLADHVILAASPIETCRLLLATGAPHAEIGRNLTDHVTVACYVLAPGGAECASSDDAQSARLRFAHAALDRGFTVEVHGPKPLDAAIARALAGDGLAAREGMACTVVAALGEQLPHIGRSMRLDPTRGDRLGRPVPVLRLAASAEDIALLDAMREACTDVGTQLGGAEIVEIRNSLEAPQVFHPGGVARFGRDGAAPVDDAGRLGAWPNVWIADASVLPTSGDTYPTLTVIAHVHRLVDRLLAAL
jgi:choline dehydrogenase-like flavoprotein